MRFKHRITIALDGLHANRSRSALTILGIVIGIAAIIMIVSIGQGARDLIVGQIQGLGTKTIVVIPGRQPTGLTDFAQILFSDSLKERDLDLLRMKTNVPAAVEVMPVVFGGELAAYGSETFRISVMGATELIMRIFDIRLEEGIFFTDDDVRNRSDVAVIGSRVRDELFGTSNPIGERIKIKGRNFRVIGVIEKKGQVSFFNFDEMALVPYTTGQQYIFGIKYFHRFIVEAESEEAVSRTVRDVQLTLRESHGITDPGKDDFWIETSADSLARLDVITNVLTLFLVAVAAISLVVGGIGIMNIMLVSVTERTREIGLRKAIGATDKDILLQFLFEAILLTATGGVVGILLGAGVSFGIAVILSGFVGLDWLFTFPVSAALVGLTVAVGVGLIFGLYPARHAAKKDPIESLRYE